MKKIGIIFILISAILLQSFAFANEIQEIKAAFTTWQEALASGRAENVVQLYDKEAVLLATLDPIPLTTQASRNVYFKKLTSIPKIKVTLDKIYLRLLDPNNATINGLYTFSYEDKHHHLIMLPARFTIVYQKENNQWMIVAHHSSKLPQVKTK